MTIGLMISVFILVNMSAGEIEYSLFYALLPMIIEFMLYGIILSYANMR